MNRRLTALITLGAAVFLLAGAPANAQGEEVARWNRIANDAMATRQTDPLTESRMLAILHLAIHDTLNTIEPRYRTFGTVRTATRGASTDAAVASAAHTTLTTLLPDCATTFDRELRVSLEAVTNKDARDAGVTTGRTLAMAILAMRANDGASRTVSYEAGTRPGGYRPTPPDFTPALFPQWGTVTPFALKDRRAVPADRTAAAGQHAGVDRHRNRAVHRRLDEHDAHGGADRDLEVLVRELDPGLESHRP